MSLLSINVENVLGHACTAHLRTPKGMPLLHNAKAHASSNSLAGTCHPSPRLPRIGASVWVPRRMQVKTHNTESNGPQCKSDWPKGGEGLHTRSCPTRSRIAQHRVEQHRKTQHEAQDAQCGVRIAVNLGIGKCGTVCGDRVRRRNPPSNNVTNFTKSHDFQFDASRKLSSKFI